MCCKIILHSFELEEPDEVERIYVVLAPPLVRWTMVETNLESQKGGAAKLGKSDRQEEG